MAYEIISQNNTTTTLSDGVNVIRVPARVVLATSTTYTVTKVNNNTATLEDGNGKVYKDIPCVAVLYGGSGGGGGSSLPDQTGHSGEFLTTDGTDASWEAISQLPDQTGHNARYLTTNGTTASWSTYLPVTNNSVNAPGTYTFAGASAYSYGSRYNLAIGFGANIGEGLTSNAIAIGHQAQVEGNSAVAIGDNATASAAYAIQLGRGTNNTTKTFSVGLDYSKNYTLLSSDGTIPADRTSPVTSVATTTLTQTLDANYTYNCGEMTSLDISFPATPAVNYISQLNFSSGATPTSITAPNTVIWLGNDITGGVFVPVASKRYCVLFFYDGTAVRGLVQGA